MIEKEFTCGCKVQLKENENEITSLIPCKKHSNVRKQSD
jgi:hypothetical protein